MIKFGLYIFRWRKINIENKKQQKQQNQDVQTHFEKVYLRCCSCDDHDQSANIIGAGDRKKVH